jgi:hypothetical protein
MFPVEFLPTANVDWLPIVVTAQSTARLFCVHALFSQGLGVQEKLLFRARIAEGGGMFASPANGNRWP